MDAPESDIPDEEKKTSFRPSFQEVDAAILVGCHDQSSHQFFSNFDIKHPDRCFPMVSATSTAREKSVASYGPPTHSDQSMMPYQTTNRHGFAGDMLIVLPSP